MTVIGIKDDGVRAPDSDNGSETQGDMIQGETEGNVTCQIRVEGTQKKGKLNENKEERDGSGNKSK